MNHMIAATCDEDRLGIRIGEAARMIGVSVRTLHRLIAANRTPPTYRLGGVVVFRAEDLREWGRRGFCDRETFESIHESQPGIAQ